MYFYEFMQMALEYPLQTSIGCIVLAIILEICYLYEINQQIKAIEQERK